MSSWAVQCGNMSGEIQGLCMQAGGNGHGEAGWEKTPGVVQGAGCSKRGVTNIFKLHGGKSPKH